MESIALTSSFVSSKIQHLIRETQEKICECSHSWTIPKTPFTITSTVKQNCPPPPFNLMEKSIISADYRLFLDFLKKTREDIGVTQIQIAKKLKITQSQVSKIERGERRLDFIELRRWLRALRVPIPDFVTRFEAYVKESGKIKPKLK